MRDAFSYCHPVVNFIFYIGALVMGMFFWHPVAIFSSVIFSLAYYIIVMKRRGRYLLTMLGLWLAVALLNPLFNPMGDTVLFSYFNERHYTYEALCFGIVMGAVFITVLTWFATYNQIMTSDKFLYCFGKLAPSVTLILTMVLRMVPLFQKKSSQIAGARKCIGKSIEDGTNYEKVQNGITIVSSLTSWALEGGIVMADSMQSRGYGCGKRTSFSIYRMRAADKGLLASMLLFVVIIVICSFKGGLQASYLPGIEIAQPDNFWTITGLIGYMLFLAIPTVMNIVEDVRWHILKSRI